MRILASGHSGRVLFDSCRTSAVAQSAAEFGSVSSSVPVGCAGVGETAVPPPRARLNYAGARFLFVCFFSPFFPPFLSPHCLRGRDGRAAWCHSISALPARVGGGEGS